MKYIPHKYQSYATDFILNNPISALFLHMGLGKSVITLNALFDLLLDSFQVRKVLVIAPLPVVRDTWPSEIEKWDHLKNLDYELVIGTEKERIFALKKQSSIYLINRENINWLINKSNINFDFDMIVIDELSSFKSHKSKRFISLLTVRPKVKRIVGLTGTPTSNGLMDLWAQFRLLDFGQRLERNIKNYRKRFFMPDKTYGQKVFSYKPKPGAKDMIYELISDITISMKSIDYLEMTPCIYDEVPVYLSKEENIIYDQLKEDMIVSLTTKNKEADKSNELIKEDNELNKENNELIKEDNELNKERNELIKEDNELNKENNELIKDDNDFIKKDRELIKIDAVNAAVLSGKLLQIANGAVYDDNKKVTIIHDRKLDALEKLIKETGDKPLLIAYWFNHDLLRIKKRFQVREIKTSQDVINWNNGKIKVAAIHPASAGHGLNLQMGGCEIVWFALTWSLELYQQTNARLHRQGQSQTVKIHHIITKGTIDEDVIKAISQKEKTQSNLIDAVKANLNITNDKYGGDTYDY